MNTIKVMLAKKRGTNIQHYLSYKLLFFSYIFTEMKTSELTVCP